MKVQYMMAIALATLLLAAPAVGLAQPSVPADQTEQETIDPNTADEQGLQRVPGIGPAMAQRIIEFRQEHGPFERLEDLLDVRGIGEKTLDKLRPYLKIEEREEGEGGS